MVERPPRRILKRTLLVLAGLAAPLVALELGLRVFDPFHFGEILEREQLAEAILERREGILQLRPGARSWYLGHEVVISAQGMRNPEVEMTKPDGVYRILVVGDSVAFGWGIAERDSFPRVLERMLTASSFRGGHVEVVNAGHPGWGVVEYYNFLKEAGLAFDPDLVVVTFVNNDMPIREFLPDDQPPDPRRPLPAWARGSYLARAIKRAVDLAAGVEREADYFLDLEVILEAMSFVCKVFGEMDALCGDVPMLIVDTVGERGGRRLDAVVECLRVKGIPRIDAYLASPKYAEEFAVSVTDPHPNEKGHLLMAQWIHDWITK